VHDVFPYEAHKRFYAKVAAPLLRAPEPEHRELPIQ